MKMKNESLITKIGLGILLVSIVGTLWHFVYDWSGKMKLLGYIFPVNESTWEHMKIAFFPMLFYAIYLRMEWKEEWPGVCFATNAGILAGTWLIPIIFYSYQGILGFGMQWMDIATFYIAIVLAYVATFHIINRTGYREWKIGTNILRILNALMLIAFVIFAYYPPSLGIFLEP